MTNDDKRFLLARLRHRLTKARTPAERYHLQNRVRSLASDLAAAEYAEKAAPLKRAMAGAYR